MTVTPDSPVPDVADAVEVLPARRPFDPRPLFAGAAIGLCWLPAGVALLMPVAFALMQAAVERAETTRDAARTGFWIGVGRYATASHFLLWLIRYSPLAIVFYGLAILYILPFAVLEGCGALWLSRRLGWPRWFGFALLYAFGEWVRTVGELSFPADPLAHGLGPWPLWLAWTRWLGPFMVPLLAGASGALLLAAWRSRDERPVAWRRLAAGIVLWTLPPLTGLAIDARAAAESAPPLTVGIVQPCVPLDEKIDVKRAPATWARLEALTRKAAAGADLVVWPETARPGPLVWNDAEPFHDDRVESLSRRFGVPIVYGCEIVRVHGDKPVAIFNGAAIVYPDDRRARWYGKQQLLPFVEGLPFAKVFGPRALPKNAGEGHSLLTMLGHFTAGPGPVLFDVGRARIAVLICYEGLYTTLGRSARLAGANALFVLTNDAWWGHSVFPFWHARVAAARARELDIPVVRAANNGLSSLTSRDGRVITSTKLDEVRTLQVPLAPGSSERTLYTRLGNLPLLAIVLALGAWFTLRRPR